MAQTLEQFVAETEKHLRDFAGWWLKNHLKNPKDFPLEMPDGDEGEWWEQFQDFDREE